ncbi:MAG: amino acid ABC transporter permease [Rhodospirillales bacterium]|nr:amino acid ABC transporter permease [Rhodospirillales bacterium]MDH3969746.1 amino acid ABC transporter permease [Rhodospirillales bacterium]
MPDHWIDLWEQPWSKRLLLFFLLFGLIFALDPSGTGLARVVLPMTGFGTGEEAGFGPRVLLAAILAAVLAINLVLILKLPLKLQILVVWAELLGMFLGFFYSFDLSFPFIVVRLPILILTGAFTTIYVSMISIAFACVLAMAGALARLSKNGPAFGIATFYISFFRGTPLLLQVYVIYAGLPQLGIILDAVPSGIIALSLCYGAYMAEIFRAGIEGVPKGQAEAATALGLKKGLIMRKVVLPQAMKLIVPPTGNQFIAMLKDSSLVSVVGVQELMFLARTQGRSEFKHFEMLITAAVIYWIISFCFELIQARLEAYYGKGDVR